MIVPAHDVAGFARVSLICRSDWCVDRVVAETVRDRCAVSARRSVLSCRPRGLDQHDRRRVVLLNDSYASTAIGPIEVFHSAGLLWNALKGEALSRASASRSLRWMARVSPAHIRCGCCRRSPSAAVKNADLIIVPSSGLEVEDQFARHAALLPWLRKWGSRAPTLPAPVQAPLISPRPVSWMGTRLRRIGRPLTTSVGATPRSTGGRKSSSPRTGACFAAAASIRRWTSACTSWRNSADKRSRCSAPRRLLINMPRASQSGYAVLPLSRPHDDDKIRSAEAYMEKNYARDISIERLARDLNMSPRNFIRRFKVPPGACPATTCRPCAWPSPRRCSRMCARSLQAVSAAVGYDDAAFFRAVFKRCTGMTPGEYRENFTGVSSVRPDFAKRPRVVTARSFLIEALRFDQKRESCSEIYDVEQDSRFSRHVAVGAR